MKSLKNNDKTGLLQNTAFSVLIGISLGWFIYSNFRENIIIFGFPLTIYRLVNQLSFLVFISLLFTLLLLFSFYFLKKKTDVALFKLRFFLLLFSFLLFHLDLIFYPLTTSMIFIVARTLILIFFIQFFR